MFVFRISLANEHIASDIFFVLSVESVRSTRSFSMSLNSDRISSFVRGILSEVYCKVNKLLAHRR